MALALKAADESWKTYTDTFEKLNVRGKELDIFRRPLPGFSVANSFASMLTVLIRERGWYGTREEGLSKERSTAYKDLEGSLKNFRGDFDYKIASLTESLEASGI